MLYLFIALAALVVGPVVFDRLRTRPAHRAFVDGFVVVSIPGLILLHVLPSALELGSVWMVIALAAGFALPGRLEAASAYLRNRVDRWGLLLGLVGLSAHSGLDGAALASVGANAAGISLPLAVLLHRFPVGAGVWWLVSGQMGRRGAMWAIGFLMLATVAGYQLGEALVQAWAGSILVDLGQAFAGGTLMHVVAHRISHPTGEGDTRARWLLGGLVAAALLAGVALIPE